MMKKRKEEEEEADGTEAEEEEEEQQKWDDAVSWSFCRAGPAKIIKHCIFFCMLPPLKIIKTFDPCKLQNSCGDCLKANRMLISKAYNIQESNFGFTVVWCNLWSLVSHKMYFSPSKNWFIML
jgi:hypothetical protein